MSIIGKTMKALGALEVSIGFFLMIKDIAPAVGSGLVACGFYFLTCEWT